VVCRWRNVPTGVADLAIGAVQRDWRVDAGPDDGLSLEKFNKAVFELADQWTTTTEAAECVTSPLVS
jgi:hypothetical protein